MRWRIVVFVSTPSQCSRARDDKTIVVPCSNPVQVHRKNGLKQYHTREGVIDHISNQENKKVRLMPTSLGDFGWCLRLWVTYSVISSFALQWSPTQVLATRSDCFWKRIGMGCTRYTERVPAQEQYENSNSNIYCSLNFIGQLAITCVLFVKEIGYRPRLKTFPTLFRHFIIQSYRHLHA